VRTFGPGEIDSTYYGETNIIIPAGETELSVSVGEGQLVERVAIAAGETVERDMIVGIGHVVFNAFYVEGMRVEDSGVTFNIVGKKDIAGNRKDFGTSYGPDTAFDLPPGDYAVLASMGEAQAETPFTVEAGIASNVDSVLDAGVLAIEAPGMDFIEIFGAKKDIQGNRQGFGYGYGGALQSTLPAGDYVVVAHTPDSSSSKEAEASVVAGERTEISVE
jgi:Ca-activated chloride channel family protein